MVDFERLRDWDAGMFGVIGKLEAVTPLKWWGRGFPWEHLRGDT